MIYSSTEVKKTLILYPYVEWFGQGRGLYVQIIFQFSKTIEELRNLNYSEYVLITNLFQKEIYP